MDSREIEAEFEATARVVPGSERNRSEFWGANWGAVNGPNYGSQTFVFGEHPEDPREELYRWISTWDCEANHRSVWSDILTGSGEWLLKQQKFIRWRDEISPSFLWLHGIPGSGKTKLVSKVVQTFLDDQNGSNSPKVDLAYVYCKKTTAEPERQRAEGVMRVILRQLCEKNGKLQEGVNSAFKECNKKAKSYNTLRKQLDLEECSKLIAEHSDIAMVWIVDALDECDEDERKKLLLAILTLYRSCRKLKVFISSRDEDNIVLHLQDMPEVYINAIDNDEDIKRFVRERVEMMIGDGQLLHTNVTADFKEWVIDALCKNHKGMFLAVVLQLKTLTDKKLRLERDVRNYFLSQRTLPSKLTELWHEIYTNIEQSPGNEALQPDIQHGQVQRSVAHRVLKWLLCQQRKLNKDEFMAAVSVDEKGIFADSLYPDLIVSLCRHMVKFDNEAATFDFTHLSASEYLEHRDGYQPEELHSLAAIRCISTYTADYARSAEVRGENDVLRPYATFHWPIHCYRALQDQNGQLEWADELNQKVTGFFLKGTGPAVSFNRWLDTVRKCFTTLEWGTPLRTNLEAVTKSQCAHLFTACCFGLLPIIRHFADLKDLDWNQRTHDGDSVLDLAAVNGHEATVAWLLTNKVKVDARDEDGKTALHRAAGKGHVSVVELLLDAGAGIDAEYKGEWTALHLAAGSGHDAVVEKLVGRGACVNKSNNQGWTPLHRAAVNGREKAMTVLLTSEASVNAQDKEGLTPLHRAADYGRLAATRLLVEFKANIEVRDSRGWKAEQRASHSGHQEVANFLKIQSRK